MPDFANLNGVWTGWYNYGGLGDSVPFTAWFDDHTGLIRGSTLEPNTISEVDLEDLEGEIQGARDGGTVAFTKTYRPGQGVHNYDIWYEGDVDEDCCRLSGLWRFQNAYMGRGEFSLKRSSRGLSSKVLRRVMIGAGRDNSE